MQLPRAEEEDLGRMTHKSGIGSTHAQQKQWIPFEIKMETIGNVNWPPKTCTMVAPNAHKDTLCESKGVEGE
jgi:hypothetical protein